MMRFLKRTYFTQLLTFSQGNPLPWQTYVNNESLTACGSAPKIPCSAPGENIDFPVASANIDTAGCDFN